MVTIYSSLLFLFILVTAIHICKATRDLKLGKTIQDNIKSENIKNYLRLFTKEPHQAGTDANNRVGDAIAKSWSDAGIEDVHFIPYEVLLSYPDWDRPNHLVIQKATGEEVFRSKGVSPVIIPEEQSAKHAGHQWVAYSGNGTASADVVYVNRGTAEDFATLKSLGITVKGKIALMRYGKLYRGDKVFQAQSAGAIGAVLFSDPLDCAQDGIEPENVYPNKNWMPNEGVQRGSLLDGFGDPLSPHYPSKKELFKGRTIQEAKDIQLIPSIPVLPISYTTAYEVLKRMTGKDAPKDWQGLVGGKNFTYKIGPGFADGEKFTINVYSELKTKKIRNVIGYIHGAVEPDRYVMLGNHYDAWVYGAIDPNSGTAVLAEVARAMMQTINETKWRPARSIVFNAWDAEEYSLIGSTEFVEEYNDILQQRAIVYLNMDCVFGNTSLYVETVPMLEHVAISASKLIANPTAKERSNGRSTLFETWSETFPDPKTTGPLITVPGAASDDAAFLNFAGVPVIGITFKNQTYSDLYPLYHSMYETPFLNVHLLDVEDLAIHRSLGQYWVELTLAFSEETILPMNVTHYGYRVIQDYIPELKASVSKLNVLNTVMPQVDLLVKTAQDLMVEAEKFQKVKNSAKEGRRLDSVNNRLMSIEKCFINPRGVSKQNPSARHVLFSASDSDSYSNALMAGVQNAIADYEANLSPKTIREIMNQISIVQFSLICVTNTLRDFI